MAQSTGQGVGNPIFPLYAGIAEVDLTPQSPVDLSGFIARRNPSVGVHDPIFARALALHDGATTLLMLSCDVLGIDASTVRGLRRAITSTTAVPEGNILIAATHTHSAPATMFLQHCGEVDPNWLEQLKGRIVNVAQMALQAMQPARCLAGSAQVTAASANRRQPNGPLDPELGLVRFDTLSDSPIALIGTFACHPITPGASNRLISADFPGVFTRCIAEQTGAVALFGNGACADINPASLVNVPIDQSGDFVLVEELGRTLARAALSVWDQLTPLADVKIAVARRLVRVPLCSPPSTQELAAVIEQATEQIAYIRRSGLPSHRERSHHAMLAWAEACAQLQDRNRLPTFVRAEIQVIRLGTLAFVAVPGELFVDLGLAIKQQSPVLRTHIVTYANGNVGYLPTSTAYAQGGYEVDIAHRYYGYPASVAPEAGNIVVNTALELLYATQ